MARVGHDVAVTGLGLVTPIGSGVGLFWEALLAGRSGARELDFGWLEGRPFKSRVGAPALRPEGSPFDLEAGQPQLVDPVTRDAVCATAMALADAGIETRLVDPRHRRHALVDVDPERAGVVMGTGIGGLITLEQSHRVWTSGERIGVAHRLAIPKLIANAVPAQVAIRFGLHGECKAVCTACASGTMAIGDGYRLVRDGELDLAVCGGAERIVSDADGFGTIGFDLLNTLSTRNLEPARASRPFDRDRDGFVLGEGAAVLLLEREAQARARGARVYARIVGYGTTADASSMVQLAPDGDQMLRAMRRALDSSPVADRDVGYVNAHGTSTLQNDALEARALRRLFGAHVADVAVNSTKAMTGHTIGAAGAIEAAVTALSLFHGVVHRCVNLDNPDPECDLNFPLANRALRLAAALSNSFAFGGHNATLVLQAA